MTFKLWYPSEFIKRGLGICIFLTTKIKENPEEAQLPQLPGKWRNDVLMGDQLGKPVRASMVRGWSGITAWLTGYGAADCIGKALASTHHIGAGLSLQR